MHVLLYTLSTWFQPEATSGVAQPSSPSGGGGGGGGGPLGGGGFQQLGLMVLMMVVFYLVLIRPQQKKQKELDKLLKGLKKGQKVRTTGGIRGEIIEFKSENGDEVVLQIADRVKINILRSHVAGIADSAATVSVAESEQKTS
ncbi:MAG TPA: preprotein translocase subunit YajC [Polyangiales bacterium]|nr:preprotein translocase subunit YajC [Polyangiales bacterium]